MNILFRADSSSTIGIGHIMRDLVLAGQFRDDEILFTCRSLEGHIMDKIPYPVKILSSMDIEELILIVKQEQIDMLVIDHYGIHYEDEKRIKEATGVKIFVLDDTYEKHYCDVLLNQSIHATKPKYINLVPNNTILLVGKKYILLDRKFYIQKRQNPCKKYILVSLGGGDIENIIYKIASSLQGSKEKVIFILPQYKSFSLRTKRLLNSNRYTILPFVDNMAKMMNQAFFIISSLGMTAYEVIFLNKEAIFIKTANNQNKIAKHFQKIKIHFFENDNFRLEKKSQYLKNMINPKITAIQQALEPLLSTSCDVL